jgi:hypothetical protein
VVVKFFGTLDTSEMSGALNTVYGAAIGAYMGIVLPTAKADVVSFNEMTGLFGLLTFIVVILQLLGKMFIFHNGISYIFLTGAGLGAYYIGARPRIIGFGIDSTFLDATIVAWFSTVWMFSVWARVPQRGAEEVDPKDAEAKKVKKVKGSR